MHSDLRKLSSAGLLQTILVSSLLFAPLVSQAQVLFASGEVMNAAPNVSNLAFGYQALFSNPMGNDNIAIGSYALHSNTTGYDNIAIGFAALNANTTGSFNTATGSVALTNNTTGSDNTANGFYALLANTTGYSNTANGSYASFSNTTGNNNTANGSFALFYNTTGFNNTVTGSFASFSNTTGYYNTASGAAALYANTSGNYNTANGVNALRNNTTGVNNIAVGYNAGTSLTTGNSNITIGNTGQMGDAGVIRLGSAGNNTATYIAGINGVTSSRGVAVYINANGQLGTLTSSRRFKNDIKDMGTVSEKLMQLRPVTFRYNDMAEKGNHALQYGLIAEEVAKVYPDLVQYDKAGKPFTIYYHLLTPMLLNELQKEHRRNEAQKTEITVLKSELAALKQSQQQQLAALTKLTALVETSQNKTPMQSLASAPR